MLKNGKEIVSFTWCLPNNEHEFTYQYINAPNIILGIMKPLDLDNTNN